MQGAGASAGQPARVELCYARAVRQAFGLALASGCSSNGPCDMGGCMWLAGAALVLVYWPSDILPNAVALCCYD